MATDRQHPQDSPARESVAPGGPDGPVEVFESAELDRLLSERKFDRASLQPDLESLQKLRDFTVRWSDVITERPVYSRAWPPGLYIPGDTDWRKYWFTPPPHENIYHHGSSDSTNHGPATFADSAGGHFAAVISPTRLSGEHTARAALAIEYSPTARLSQVRFTADLTYSGVKTYKFFTESGYSRIVIEAKALLAGWEINPVTLKWEQLRPVHLHRVFDDVYTGTQASGPPITYRGVFHNGVLGVNFLVERGKRYAFGVSFQSRIDLDVRERDDRKPYRQQEQDVIELEARLGGSALQMTVDTTVVYQA